MGPKSCLQLSVQPMAPPFSHFKSSWTQPRVMLYLHCAWLLQEHLLNNRDNKWDLINCFCEPVSGLNIWHVLPPLFNGPSPSIQQLSLTLGIQPGGPLCSWILSR